MMLLRFLPFRAFAGFPSPGENHFERPLSLDELVTFDPDATYFMLVEGDSMSGANIASGDVLVISRAIEPASGTIVIVTLDGHFLVKRIVYAPDGGITLHADHPSYPPVTITPERHFRIWGVAIFVLHPLHPLAAHRLHPSSERRR